MFHQPSLDHILDLTLWPDKTCSLRTLHAEQEAKGNKAACSSPCLGPARKQGPFQEYLLSALWPAATGCPGNDDLTA